MRLYDSFFKVFNRPDLSRYDVEPECRLPIYGIYHIMLDDGWQDLAHRQMENLKASGLLNVTCRLYISCIAKDKADMEQLKSIIDSEKAEFIFVGSDPMRYEYPALEFVKQLCDGQECLMYYFHSKGISYQSAVAADHCFIRFKQKIDAWREMLEYFIFQKWRVAVNVLLSGFDTYGCYTWPPDKAVMYSGSFWWASSKHIRRLPHFDKDVIAADRFYSETWLFTCEHRFFSAFDTLADLYYVHIPESIYKGDASFLTKAHFVLTYNWRKFEKHVLHYSYKNKCQQRFQRLKEKL